MSGLPYKLPPSYSLGSKGVGSFLEPPNHPRYEAQGIYTGHGNDPPAAQMQIYYRGRGYRTIEGLDRQFKPLPYTHQLVKLWEEDLYAYMSTCYSQDGIDRNVSNAKCGVKPGGMPPERHLAYLAVKKYYPEAKPRLDLIKTPPAWGKDRSKAYGKVITAKLSQSCLPGPVCGIKKEVASCTL